MIRCLSYTEHGTPVFWHLKHSVPRSRAQVRILPVLLNFSDLRHRGRAVQCGRLKGFFCVCQLMFPYWPACVQRIAAGVDGDTICAANTSPALPAPLLAAGAAHQLPVPSGTLAVQPSMQHSSHLEHSNLQRCQLAEAASRCGSQNSVRSVIVPHALTGKLAARGAAQHRVRLPQGFRVLS